MSIRVIIHIYEITGPIIWVACLEVAVSGFDPGSGHIKDKKVLVTASLGNPH